MHKVILNFIVFFLILYVFIFSENYYEGQPSEKNKFPKKAWSVIQLEL